MMDKYIPTLAGCLHDKSELVRRQALTMLTRMLQVLLLPAMRKASAVCLLIVIAVVLSIGHVRRRTTSSGRARCSSVLSLLLRTTRRTCKSLVPSNHRTAKEKQGDR